MPTRHERVITDRHWEKFSVSVTVKANPTVYVLASNIIPQEETVTIQRMIARVFVNKNAAVKASHLKLGIGAGLQIYYTTLWVPVVTSTNQDMCFEIDSAGQRKFTAASGNRSLMVETDNTTWAGVSFTLVGNVLLGTR